MEIIVTPSTVRVCVRCRPLSLKEGRGKKCVTLVKDRITVGEKTFAFDSVYGETITQEEVFNGSIAALVEGCFQGFNATVLAYGQTGSGKTHTMIGNAMMGDRDEEGVIPRVVRYIFGTLAEKLRTTTGKLVPSLHVSFIEIYNDEVKDLLHPDILPRDIFIREDKMGKIFFTGAREEVVLNVENALEYLDRGNMTRTTAETLMNAASSRSHAIFTLSIELYEYCGAVESGESGETQGGGSLITSKIHLVDLAGSERVKKTGADGMRLKESVGINQGLLSLGKVIRALTTNIKSPLHATHIPYRESKLTRYLQDSLGGNSRTLMLACISPAWTNLHETLSTLQYASKAAHIQNKLVANVATGFEIEIGDEEVDGDQAEGIVSLLKNQLSEMHEEMSSLRRKAKPSESRDVSPNLVRTVSKMGWKGEGPSASSTKLSQKRLEPSQKLPVDGVALSQSLTDVLVDRSKDELIAALRKELEDLREDLKRDEEIFGEKVKELKTCRKELRACQVENGELQEKLAKYLNQEGRMTPASISTREDSKIPSKTRSFIGTHRNGALNNAISECEPNISKLMEDLETVSKEKDKIEEERLKAETKFEESRKAALEEKKNFSAVQREAASRLEALQAGMEAKQKVIADLTKAQTEAARLAEQNCGRASELEAECSAMREELQEMSKKKASTNTEVDAERLRLKEIEKKLNAQHAEKLAAVAAAAEKKAQAEAARLAEHEAKAAKLGLECAALRTELETMGNTQKTSSSKVEEEMKRRKEVEQQLLALQADKKSVMTAAAQASDGNNRRALELENELSVCKAEMEKLGQNQKKSTTQVDEEKKRRVEVEKQLQALQSEREAANKEKDGSSKRSQQLEVECTALKGQLEALSAAKDKAEEEKKKRKLAEQQLDTIEIAKQAALANAQKLQSDNEKRAAKYEAECAKLRAELEALSHSQKSTTGEAEDEKKKRIELERKLAVLKTEKDAAMAAAAREYDENCKRLQELEIQCAAFRGELEVLSMGKDAEDDERRKRKQVEQQLAALQAERDAAAAAAKKLNDDKDKKTAQYEAECAKLKTELEALSKDKKSSTTQAEEEMKRRKKVEEQLIALQAEKQAALGAAAKENDGNSKRSHQLEVECAALRGELEALSISKDSAEDERKRRKQVEQQLAALQAEKQAAVAAAAKMNSENKVRSNELEAELTALRAEMLALGKNQETSTGQVEEEMKRRKKVEEQFAALQAEKQAAVAAAQKLNDDKDKKTAQYEAECAKLKTELEALSKDKKSSTTQAEEEMKRRKKVEEQLIALQAEKQAALGAAAKENDGNSKRSHQLEVECAALRGELEALSISKDSAEDERKRRKQVEQQLLALQAEKQAAVAAAAKMNSENKVRSNELEAELTALRAEMLALGKNQETSTGQVEEEMKRRKKVEEQFATLQAEKQAAVAAAQKLNDDKDKKTAQYEAECAKLKTELEALSKDKKSSTTQVEEEMKRRKKVEEQLIALQAEKQAALDAANKEKDGSSKRSQQLEVECAALKGQLEALSAAKDKAEEEKKKRKLAEQQLDTIEIAKQAALANAQKLQSDNEKRAAKYEAECAKLRAELEALSHSQKSTTGEAEDEKKKRIELERKLAVLKTEKDAAMAAAAREYDENCKRLQELEIQCAAFRGELEVLSMGKDAEDDERRKRKQVEQQLAALQAEKQAAVAAAAKMNSENKVRSNELEAELTALRAEMLALGKNQETSTGQVEEEMKRRKKVEEQLIALQAEKQAALDAANKEKDGSSKRSQQLEVECAALKGQLEALSAAKDKAEEEKKKRKLAEQQLDTIEIAKQAALANAQKLQSDNEKRAAKYEAECAKLRAELEALSHSQKSTTGEAEDEKKKRIELERKLAVLKTEKDAAMAAAAREYDENCKRLQELEIQCAAFRGELEVLSMGKDAEDDERRKRKQVEQQLAALQAEKQAAVAAAAKMNSENKVRSNELEAELTALRAEMLALGKNQETSTGQVEEEMKRRKKVEEQLQVLQKEREAAVAAATAERNAQAEAAKLAERNKAKAMEFEAQCAALKTELEALGKNQQKSTGQVEEEKKRRLEVEKQLAALQTEKQAAILAATKISDGNKELANKLETECAALKAEMANLGLNQKASTTQVEEETKRRKLVEQQLATLQAEKKAALDAATSANEGSKKRSGVLELECAALKGELEALSLSRSTAEEERKKRKEVELQLLALQTEKRAAMTAAAKMNEGNEERAFELERELTALRLEMEMLGKDTGIVDEERKRRREVEQQLIALQSEKKIAVAAAAKLVATNEEKALELERALAALKADMATLGKSQQSSSTQVEEEKKRRLEVEKQLAALKKEKEDAMAKVIAERDSQAEATKKAERKYEADCAALRAEMETLGKNQKSSSTQIEEEKKRRLEVEQQLIVIQADKKAAMAAAAQVAGGNEAKAAELAKELSVVKAELEALGKNQQKSTGQVEEEKKRRLEVEKQLAALQAEQKATQAAATQSDLKKSDETKKAKEETKDEMLKVQAREAEKEKLFNAQQKQHRDELQSMKAEYDSLTTRIKTEESKQTKTLTSLTEEVDRYKQISATSERKLTALEQRNKELLTSIANMPKVVKQEDGGVITEAEFMRNCEALDVNVDLLVSMKSVRDLIQKLHMACMANRKESDDLQDEKDKIMSEENKEKSSLARQLSEIEVKIKKQLGIIDEKKKVMEKPDKVVGDLVAISSLSSAEGVLKTLVEQAGEIRNKLKGSVLSPAAQSRLLDIQDELDTLNVEINSNETNLYEEMQRLAMHASVLNESVDLPHTAQLSNYSTEEEESPLQAEEGVNEGVSHIIKSLLAGGGPNTKGFNEARFHYLTHLSKALVVAKYRALTVTNEIHSLRGQVDEKAAALDAHVTSAQRSRSDTLKKQEVSKKDTEEKMAYLLQQLKSAENKISRMETLAARGESKQRSSIIEEQGGSNGSSHSTQEVKAVLIPPRSAPAPAVSSANTPPILTSKVAIMPQVPPAKVAQAGSPAIVEPVKVAKMMGDVTVSTTVVTSTSNTIVTPRGQPEKEAQFTQEIKTVIVPRTVPAPAAVEQSGNATMTQIPSPKLAIVPPVPPAKMAVDVGGLGVAGNRMSANKYAAFVSGSPLKEGEAKQELNKELKVLESQMKSPAP